MRPTSLGRMKSPRLVAVGAAHLDRRGQVSEDYRPGTSNPGSLREEVGGVAFNTLRNALRHGVAGVLVSVRGGDTAGEAVARAVVEAGIEDCSATFLDRATPSYTALLDRDGELIAGLADMALYETALTRQLRRRHLRELIAGADGVLVDANISREAIGIVARLAAGPLFANAISPAKAPRLEGALSRITCLFMNRHEAAILAGGSDDVVEKLRAKGLEAAFITAGGGEVLAYRGRETIVAAPARPRRVADVTGAGDALCGAAIACLMRDMPLKEALRHGMAAAMLTVESEAVVAAYDEREFAEALALAGEAIDVA